ncbi:hypothetical protein G5714_010280 [Onychostoma macrolepis]|uniref:Uncharacterized protein n=1 Tax=Onychostoma macrolepis TaxID=369639 RepID=A0A7J6CPP4_9TELE|nr:hypothetical protein G5714_010259 [Onychostoma macrolepis]KAF4109207.1 hypothetical protein G5714_010280 [Onychostoma macrolepis]
MQTMLLDLLLSFCNKAEVLGLKIFCHMIFRKNAARIQLITSDLVDCSLSAVTVTSGAESWTFICMF